MQNELLELVHDLKKRIELDPPKILTSDASPQQEWADLSQEVKTCQLCPLGLTRTQAVLGVGSMKAQVIFVGEGPGYEEDHKGEPFVGKAGQLLDNILAAIGLSRQTVYITNCVKCHPMIHPDQPGMRGNDRPPIPEEISACRGYLDRQIALIRPKVIVTLGAVATKTLLSTSMGITSMRGRWHSLPSDPNIKVLPTYHPAALLRNPALKREVWNDMKNLKKELESD
ncbi:MAG: uracil-DNA glycosylase [Elusimicrobia bacterium]|nr:uracil-DNA glycosylase [Elusimicrobiota bacterium]